MASFTFDPENLRIIEVDTGGDNSLDVKSQLYSEWKRWVLASSYNAGFPRAIEVVGGDPITDELNLGSTFFLANKWKIRPAEANHRLTLVGNLWTRDGLDPFVDTLGSFRVTARQQVSNLVDSSVARLDLDQLLNAIYVDTENGVAGTTGTIGTPTNPVNNEADAFTLATNKNLRSYVIRGGFDVARDYGHWTFQGAGTHVDTEHMFRLNGYDVDRCLFQDMNIEGTMTGKIEAHRCGLGVLAGLDGAFVGCGFFSNFTLDSDAFVLFESCFSMVPGSGRPHCYVGADTQAQFRDYSGGLELHGLAAGNTLSVDLDAGRLAINADCTGGHVTLRGTGDLVDNSGGAVALDVAGFVSVDRIATEVHSRGKLARRFNLAQEADGVLREIE